MLRGINRQALFWDDEDCEKFLQCLCETKDASRFVLHAYCFMGNHVHLLIQESGEPLEQILKRLGVRYVYWYNRKYKRSGHLFQECGQCRKTKEPSLCLCVSVSLEVSL